MIWAISVIAFTGVVSLCGALQPQIPSVDIYEVSHAPPFVFTAKTRIVVDEASANVGSPSLLDFATTFRADLQDVFALSAPPPLMTHALKNTSFTYPTIILTTGATNFTYFSGRPTGEGYEIDILQKSVVIRGVDVIGTWWGTRTLLQQLVLAKNKKTLGAGRMRDSPGWPVRGFMLDAGRHWFEPQFIVDLCTYSSFFKLNELHLHTSDNLWNPDFLYGAHDEWKKLYAGFRLRPEPGSPVVGVVPLLNESWSRADFEGMQKGCSARGVRLVPEIDTPGHSLAIAKWKPELIIQGEPDDLNLTHPDTIPTIKALWEEFLPWIASSEISIGADEYEPSLADAYIDFVNELASHIHAKSGKTVRVWGTAEPSLTKKISRNVTIQHWDFPDASIPVRLMAQGYDVINSEQAFLYLDGKTSDDGQFPQSIDESLIWAGAPGGRGWAPNVFSATDASNNTDHTNPRLRGALFALWNDWGNNATTPLEVYYQLARSVPLVAERAWAGAGVRASELTRAQFDAAYPPLNAAAPGQNLNRVVKPAHGGVVFEYDLTHRAPGTVVQTGFPSVGPPYTLSFEVMDDPAHPGSAVLLSGSDTSLLAGSLTFVSYGQQYSLPFHLPTTRFASVEIHATREATYALVDGRRLWWTTEMDIWGEYMAHGNMSFAAPAATIGQAGSGVRFGKVSLTLGREWACTFFLRIY